ncbi:MAG: YecA family protein [Burkholderiaceae bacterium]
MNAPASPAPLPPLGEADVDRLQVLLDKIPEPLEPLDVSMLDGYLCGVLLQPAAVPAGAWLKHVFDVDGRPLPDKWAGQHELQGLVQRRYQELSRAITGRQWFDPWVFELDDEATPAEASLPWVAGFAAAMELFPALMDMDAPEAVEPLAVLYAVFDPEDLEDADELLEVIEELEPAATLDEAIEDIVQSVLRLADVGRPLPAGKRPGGPVKRPARRGPPQGGRR